MQTTDSSFTRGFGKNKNRNSGFIKNLKLAKCYPFAKLLYNRIAEFVPCTYNFGPGGHYPSEWNRGSYLIEIIFHSRKNYVVYVWLDKSGLWNSWNVWYCT